MELQNTIYFGGFRTPYNVTIGIAETFAKMLYFLSYFEVNMDHLPYAYVIQNKQNTAENDKDTNIKEKKAVRLMAQLIKFYKFYHLLYLNKRWLNSQ